MSEINPLTIICPTCHGSLDRIDVVEQNENGPRIEFYQCGRESCVGKIAVSFELSGAYAKPQPGYVEREIARRGAFYPTDYMSGGRSPRNW